MVTELRETRIWRLPIDEAQRFVDQQLFHNHLRSHQGISLSATRPEMTRSIRFQQTLERGLPVVGHSLDPVELDELIPIGHHDRRVNRFGSFRYSNRLYHLRDHPGERIDVHRDIDPLGRPVLRVWQGLRLIKTLSLFAPRIVKPGGPTKVRLDKISWTPPWPEIFRAIA